MQREDILVVQGGNSNSSQVCQHNQVAATSANSLSRLTTDTEAKKTKQILLLLHSVYENTGKTDSFRIKQTSGIN